MHNLVEYLNFRIKALMDNNAELQTENEQLRSYLFEALEEDCLKEYKDIIRHEVWEMAEKD